MSVVDFDESKYYENDLFAGEHKSVLFTVNKTIVVHAVREAELPYEDRGEKSEVAFSVEGEDDVMVFFTGSGNLRKVLLSQDISFPFRTIIKVGKLGSFLSLKFCSPLTEITEDDVKNLELFRMKQDRRFVSKM